MHTPNPKAAAYLDFLAQEGYRPRLDEDGDVAFQYQGGHFYLDTRGADPQYFQLTFPWFHEFTPEERPRVLEVAATVTAESKVVKIYPQGNDTMATVELFLPDGDAWRPVFTRAVRSLWHAVGRFRELVAD
ncbi:YbjN domain-containing protein [Deinococcus pimensis]|uniref:YbjN domain-containing protein n=1 Tax=Deinococcus pimensis TaxID=309888 RepID=UPI0004B31C5E|nr:YbjN domain-containing protein [Deinococcus pimensis]